jgi:hypothetical protein
MKELFNELYKASYTPEIEDIPEGPVEQEESPSVRIPPVPTTSKKSILLNDAEADAYEMEIDKTIENIKALRNRISNKQKTLDDKINSIKKDPTFSIDLKGNPALRKAVRKVYGKDITEISYSMYLEAKRMRRELQEKDAIEYSEGLEEEE